MGSQPLECDLCPQHITAHDPQLHHQAARRVNLEQYPSPPNTYTTVPRYPAPPGQRAYSQEAVYPTGTSPRRNSAFHPVDRTGVQVLANRNEDTSMRSYPSNMSSVRPSLVPCLLPAAEPGRMANMMPAQQAPCPTGRLYDTPSKRPQELPAGNTTDFSCPRGLDPINGGLSEMMTGRVHELSPRRAPPEVGSKAYSEVTTDQGYKLQMRRTEHGGPERVDGSTSGCCTNAARGFSAAHCTQMDLMTKVTT